MLLNAGTILQLKIRFWILTRYPSFICTFNFEMHWTKRGRDCAMGVVFNIEKSQL